MGKPLEVVQVFCEPFDLKICMRLAYDVLEISKFRFGSLLTICIKSVRSKVQKNAFTSKVQNHPKGTPKGMLKESASHHVEKFVMQTINFSVFSRFSKLCVASGVLAEKFRFFDFFYFSQTVLHIPGLGEGVLSTT